MRSLMGQNSDGEWCVFIETFYSFDDHSASMCSTSSINHTGGGGQLWVQSLTPQKMLAHETEELGIGGSLSQFCWHGWHGEIIQRH